MSLLNKAIKMSTQFLQLFLRCNDISTWSVNCVIADICLMVVIWIQGFSMYLQKYMFHPLWNWNIIIYREYIKTVLFVQACSHEINIKRVLIRT